MKPGGPPAGKLGRCAQGKHQHKKCSGRCPGAALELQVDRPKKSDRPYGGWCNAMRTVAQQHVMRAALVWRLYICRRASVSVLNALVLKHESKKLGAIHNSMI